MREAIHLGVCGTMTELTLNAFASSSGIPPTFLSPETGRRSFKDMHRFFQNLSASDPMEQREGTLETCQHLKLAAERFIRIMLGVMRMDPPLRAVGGIAHEREQVGDERRINAKLFADSWCIANCFAPAIDLDHVRIPHALRPDPCQASRWRLSAGSRSRTRDGAMGRLKRAHHRLPARSSAIRQCPWPRALDEENVFSP
jgi:hypothetical protein